MSRALAAAIAALAALANTAPARADAPDPTRTVAILEYRGGSTAIPDITARVAAILRARTSLRVVDPGAARAAYGPDLADDVAACAGEEACVARIGRAVDAREVLLLGVSELGDVIVTMQRIDTPSARVRGRVAEALPRGAEPGDDELLAYLQRVLPRADFRREGTIRVETDLGGARVRIDGDVRGVTPLPPLRVPAPARYTIEVDKRGYTAFRASIEVPPDASVTVSPTLDRRERAWYDNWYVPAIAGAVVIGAITTAIVVTRDDPTEQPATLLPRRAWR